ncbi:MAG: hypothetical protein UU48_C0032G0002 [Candidatus Uhrbacteria bacterium GW2011_GWF2_41_16]|uniref:Uncharacterized protein n=1 Tax=Candidatus Uhrbacteria bacterium GW2011_GWF2_41_16 TaxID=1618997 RepID=A0A0G0V5X2_9BACT|nr:MAG: hypothetical protein UU48_C0032G0002 [Candidatus Uhrbacteria bacterium GW2011_GWF2_41_16]
MPDDRQQEFVDDLLDLLTSRANRTRHQTRVVGPNGYRITDEIIDETAIGNHNYPDNLIARNKFIADCGHLAEFIGGRCHYCDALICRDCIYLCSNCRLAICPPHSVTANFDNQSRIYCRSCAEEITRSLKLRACGNAILSFFICNKQNT